MSASILPFPNSYWVIEGKLLAGHYPGDSNETEAYSKLKGLLDCGILHVVNLIKEKTHPLNGSDLVPYHDPLMNIADEMGIDVSYAHFPIIDFDIPTIDMMKSILGDIDSAVDSGRPVYVHCVGGIGRTGTVVGCYLARHGMAVGNDVLALMDELRANEPKRRQSSPSTWEQTTMVRSWTEGA